MGLVRSLPVFSGDPRGGVRPLAVLVVGIAHQARVGSGVPSITPHLLCGFYEKADPDAFQRRRTRSVRDALELIQIPKVGFAQDEFVIVDIFRGAQELPCLIEPLAPFDISLRKRNRAT